jgi:hypothetical protein
MVKESYIKPEVRTEILEPEALWNYGSSGSNGGHNGSDEKDWCPWI